MKRQIVVAMSCIALVGCASRSKDVSAAYVSPVLYQGLTCEQLALEAQTISSRAAMAMGQQDQKATNDAVAVTVGLVIFWPALFFMSGASAPTAEVARLKGEMQAIEQASIRNNCGIAFAPVVPTKPTLPSSKPGDNR
jgi:hypothetical protein